MTEAVAVDVLRGGDTVDLRKARGAFFTPGAIVDFITQWAIDETTEAVLEPAAGEAAFLLSAATRAGAVGGTVELVGVELHESSAAFAGEFLADHGVQAHLEVSDFFEVPASPRFDAVIGNPPYIRYQAHAGASRAASRAAAAAAGVQLSELASSWAAFVVHSTAFLRKGGKLGLVLPAELLSTNYAAPVRSFLMENFAEVDLVLFSERVFPAVQEEVVLLLASGWGQGPTDRFQLFHAHNAADLAHLAEPATWVPTSTGEKWTAAMVSPVANALFHTVVGSPAFTELRMWGKTSLGAVTGGNRYFTMTAEEVAELGLGRGEVVRISPPGSSHLRQLALTPARLKKLTHAGSATYLFRPGVNPSAAARVKIAAGEAAGVDQAYKCRVRTPWWRTPLLEAPDLFLTYMNADIPQLATNIARVRHLNSVHGVYLADPYHQLGQELLPLAALNTVTSLSAETVGRAYGGGMLKIEPREADRWHVPSPDLLEQHRGALLAIKPKVTALLEDGDRDRATALVDQVLLINGLGMAKGDLEALTQSRATLKARRIARSKSVK